MKSVTIREARAHFDALLRRARKGETIVVTSRGRPVAEIRPSATPWTYDIPPIPPGDWTEHEIDSHRRGVILLPDRQPDWRWLKSAREKNASLTGTLQALLDEREEGR